jgi:hypothetical protein
MGGIPSGARGPVPAADGPAHGALWLRPRHNPSRQACPVALRRRAPGDKEVLSRPDHRLDDGRGASFGQGHTVHRRKGALVCAAPHAPKREDIGRGICHLVHGSLDGHLAEADTKGPCGLLRCYGMTDALEQMAHDERPPWTAARDHRRSGRQAQIWGKPEPAQPTRYR